jgi:hypothetical protein
MRRLVMAVVTTALMAITGLAQTNTGRLVGTVVDPNGAVVNGATVVVRDNQTGRERTITTGDTGTFTAAQLEAGTYTVTITAGGFRTFVAQEVKIDVGRDYSLNAALEAGAVNEEVVVVSGADVINATSGELSNTVSPTQILQLPLNGRNPLALITLQPGTASNGAQGTSINGQRSTFTNITRDGLNVQDNYIRGNAVDFVQERASVDNTGEFTVTTQNAGADRGYGSSQVQIVTPRGQNEFHGALFAYNRNSKFASNTFFQNRAGTRKPFLNRNQFGGKLGGAIVRDRVFFFGSYEGLRLRTASNQTRTILTPTARQGIFTYVDNAGVTRTVNLFTTFGTSTGVTGVNPTIQSRFLDPTPTAGNRPDLGDTRNTTGFAFSQKADQDRDTYSTRIDYDINERHTLNGVFTYTDELNLRPDAAGNFDVIPDVVQPAKPKFFVMAYRYTPTARLTNEVRGGYVASAPVFLRSNPTPANFITPTLISNPETTFTDQGRDTKYYNFQDNAEYTRGNHSLRFGGLFQAFRINSFVNFGVVPTFTLGTNVNTPQITTAQFTNATLFPGGISTNQRTTANQLLALLGGIVASGTQTFNVASQESGFVPGQEERRKYAYENFALYVADQWRLAPSFTLNAGLRYEVYTALRETQGLFIEPRIEGDPVQSLLDPNGQYQFIGGNAGGGNRLYRTDKNNFAPVISFAWTPQFNNKFLGAVLGSDGRTVIRGGFRSSYVNDDLVVSQSNSVGLNQGLATTLSAINPATGTTALNARANALPTITAPGFQTFPRSFATNNTAAFSFFGTVFGIDPNLQTPRTDEWNIGIQRELGFQTALEVRYVGSRSNNLVRAIDFNQVDIRNNGFLADFNRARANLLLTGNPGCTTAGCQPLTVFPQLAAGGLLTNATIQGQLISGTPADLAAIYIQNGLAGNVRFLANPNTGVADLVGNFGILRYNALQAELRRRYAQGLYFQANYTFQKALGNASGGAIAGNNNQTRFEPNLDNLQPELEYSRVNYDQTHVFNFNTVYDLPFGKGKRWLNEGGLVDKIFGGFQITSIIRLSSGAPINISDPRGTLNRGAARATRQTPQTNLTKDQIKDLVGIFDTPCGLFYINPAVININLSNCSGTGRAAEGFGVAPFAGQVFFNNAPGQTGSLERFFLNGPTFFNWDAGINKRISLTENTRLELRAEAFNVTNRANFFAAQNQNINSSTFGRITSQFTQGGGHQRVLQFAARFEF